MKRVKTSDEAQRQRTAAYLAIALMAGLSAGSPAVLAEMVEYRGKMLDIATPGEVFENQVVVVAETPQAKLTLGQLARQMKAAVKRDITGDGMDTRMQLWQFGSATEATNVLTQLEKLKGIHAYKNPKMSIIPPPEVVPQLKKRFDPEGMTRSLPQEKSAANTGARSEKPTGAPSDDVNAQWSSNDPAVSSQWALWRVNEPLADAPPAGVKGIAIIDTGVDYNHSDLVGKVVSVKDYVDNDNDAMDAHGHGTHCAGIAAAKANNSNGIRGASPNSKIYAYRVLDEYGSGSFVDIIAAIRAAANDSRVHVLSLSLGGYALEGSSAYNDIKAAVDYAVTTKGKILVAAAGNEMNNDLYYYQWYGHNYRIVPAWAPNSFTVAATTETDSRAYFSNYDIKRASPDSSTTYNWNFVDIAAPGTNILSTTMGDGYERWSGTSMATPLVAGAAARVWDKNTAWTAAQVRSQLVNTGTTLGVANGFPLAEKRLDMYKALGGRLAGGFIGRVLNGESGAPLTGVKVDAMKGTTVAATVYSNKAGYYTLPNLSSYTLGYKLRLSKSGFVTRTTPSVGNRPAGTLRSVTDQPIAPSRATTTADENWRIIAAWQHTNPGFDYWYLGWYYGGFEDYFPFTSYHARGLEANAYLRTPSGSTYYWGNSGSLSSAPYTKYMHDSWNDDIPLETHVIRDQQTGTYKYWLRVDPYDDGWGSIKYGLGTTANPSYPSYPVVLVYKGNTLVKTINASSATRDGVGTKYWNVLTLTGNTVTVINRVTDTAP